MTDIIILPIFKKLCRIILSLVEKKHKLCENMYMQEDKNIISSSKVVEAEILDENGRPVGAAEDSEKLEEHMARAGFFAGFVALAFSVIMILVTAVVTVFIVLPLMLLGRILGMQIKTFRR